MCLRNLVLIATVLGVGLVLTRGPAGAMPLPPRPSVETAAGVSPVFFRRGPSGVVCKRQWSRVQGWYDNCRRVDWSPGNVEDLRQHPSLTARCWVNRDGYNYCPDSHSWNRRYLNRRCYIDKAGQPQCVPPKEARFPGKTGP